jgi:hypothetical protein
MTRSYCSMSGESAEQASLKRMDCMFDFRLRDDGEIELADIGGAPPSQVVAPKLHEPIRIASIDSRFRRQQRSVRRFPRRLSGNRIGVFSVSNGGLRHDRFQRLPLCFHPDMRIVLSICLETCPAISRMVSSPAPLSARSVIRACRLSCQRPLTPAFFRALFHDVFNVTTGRVGSFGRGLPNGKTYQSG